MLRNFCTHYVTLNAPRCNAVCCIIPKHAGQQLKKIGPCTSTCWWLQKSSVWFMANPPSPAASALIGDKRACLPLFMSLLKMEQFTALCIITVFLKLCLPWGWGEGRITPSFGSNSPLIDLISPVASYRSRKKKGFPKKKRKEKKKDILCINHLVYPNHKEIWKMEMVGRITCCCFLW